jgi:cytochrome c2
MWNHAPTMWSVIQQKAFKVGELDPQAAADLFASFYSARYFEMPGDAGRGKGLFTTKSCANCHGLATSPNPQARPINQWQAISDPVALVGAMWNHSPDMWSELAKKKIAWPALTSQEFSDLLVYLRNISPAARATASTFQVTAGENGARLFESKGCTGCHRSAQSTGGTLTLTGIAASMWNHASFLHLEPPRLETPEMREVLSYYWAKQFFEAKGDPSRGRRLFAAKRCTDCHSGSGPGAVLAEKAGTWNGITMVSALWRHGPAMLNQMNAKKISWPVFKTGEMADLIAHLNGNTNGKSPR